jgi:uncharacterized membrane protein
MSRTSLVRHVFAAGLLPAGAVLLLIGLAVGVPVFGMTPPGLALVIAGGLLVAASAIEGQIADPRPYLQAQQP